VVRRALSCLILLAVAACDGSTPVVPVVAASEPLPALPTSPAPVLFPITNSATIDTSVVVEPLIPAEAIDLIVSFEIGSPELYERRYKSPIWPGAHSGPTVGVGYDLGTRQADIIIVDWEAHPHAARMATAAGITGPISRDWVRKAADISVEYGMARQVFDQTSLVEHYRVARRVFGPAFDRAPGVVRGSLSSLVFNRGGSMRGDGRREMRAIRDTCLPAGNWDCVAFELRGMKRIWKGSDIEVGMNRRREAEAKLAESA